MNTRIIQLPQLGEGVRTATIVKLHKPAGSLVARDETIVDVETDKATYSIEAPFSGRLSDWRCREGDQVPVHSVLVELTGELPVTPATRNGVRPPRQRLTPAVPERSATTVCLEMRLPWEPVQKHRSACRQAGLFVPTTTELVTGVILQTLANPAFASIRGDSLPVVGIAVALPSDGLATAVVQAAHNCHLSDLYFQIRCAVNSARRGEPPIPVCPHLLFSNLSAYKVVRAMPAVVPPSHGTVFLGEPSLIPVPGQDRSLQWQREASLCFSFNHSSFHGAGAARFLQQVIRRLTRKELM